MAMKTRLLTITSTAMLTFASAVPAAEITNADAKSVVVTVVENGSRLNLPLSPGATESICPSGCFITAPNGDRVGLSGGETVEITGGAAIVK
jgi:hypothetical protein